MNSACPVCNSVFWKNEGECIGPMVIDYTVAVGGALLSWAALVFFSFSGTLQVVIPAAVAVGGSIGVVPWSRSFWTLFLYITAKWSQRTGVRLNGRPRSAEPSSKNLRVAG
jgi:hypothetical protein